MIVTITVFSRQLKLVYKTSGVAFLLSQGLAVIVLNNFRVGTGDDEIATSSDVKSVLGGHFSHLTLSP